MLLESLAILLLGLPSLVLLFAGILILNFGRQVLNISFDSLFQKIIPLEKLGTYKGVFDVSILAVGVFGLGVLTAVGFFILINSIKKE